MAKVLLTLEDTANGVSLDIRQASGSSLFSSAGQTPAQHLARHLHETANFHMALNRIPRYRIQHSDAIH